MSGLQTVCVSCGQSGCVQPVVLPVAESGKRYHDEIHACIQRWSRRVEARGEGRRRVYPPSPPPGWEGLPKWKCCVCVYCCVGGWVGNYMGYEITHKFILWFLTTHALITCTEWLQTSLGLGVGGREGGREGGGGVPACLPF